MTAIREDKVWHDFFYTELTTRPTAPSPSAGPSMRNGAAG